MLDFIKRLWNPVAFWISFMMSIIMPIIFGDIILVEMVFHSKIA